MCKKIAKLTKTVFRYHTDSIDHRDAVTDLKQRYEAEVAAISSLSKELLEEERQECDDLHETIESVVKEEFEAKFQVTKQLFREAKVRAEKESERLLSTAKKKLSTLREDFKRLKETVENDIAEINNEAKEVQELHKSSIGNMHSARERKISNSIDEAREKHDMTLAQTRQKEKELKKQFQAELDDLRQALDDAKVSAEDALAKKQQNIESTIKQFQAERETLAKDIQKAETASEDYEKEIEKALEKAQAMQKAIMKAYEEDLKTLRDQLKKVQSEAQAEKERAKKKYEKEEQSYMDRLAEKKEKVDAEKESYKKHISDMEAAAEAATREAERKNQTIIDEHKEAVKQIESERVAFVQGERLKGRKLYKKIAAVEKKHAQEVENLREEMERLLSDGLRAMEEMRENHRKDLELVRSRQKEELESVQNEITKERTSDEDRRKQTMLKCVKLRNALELSKANHEVDMNELEFEKNAQLNAENKRHEAVVSKLEQDHELELKELETVHGKAMEKAKKQFVLDLKSDEEKGNLSLKHATETFKQDTELRRSQEVEDQKEKWEIELADISVEIERKTTERKDIEAQMKKDEQDKRKQIQDLKDEIKQREASWVEEKQQLVNSWNEKFEVLKKQFEDEEHQNEAVRRMPANDCQKMIDDLNKQVTEEENRKATELAKINQEIEAEKKKSSQTIHKLEKKIQTLTGSSETSVEGLSKKLESLSSEKEEKLRQADDKRRETIRQRSKKLREVQRKCTEELNQKKADALKSTQEYERKLQEAKKRLEQAKLDSQFEIEAFEAQAAKETSQAENKHKHSLDLLNIELDTVQKDCEWIREAHTSRIRAMTELQSQQKAQSENEFKLHQQNTANDIQAIVAAKEAQIEALKKDIKECSDKTQGNSSRPETSGQIECLRTFLEERKESADRLERDFKKYEAAMTQHESLFARLASANPTSRSESQPTILTPVSVKRSRHDGTSSRRKTPTLVEPRRSRTNI